MHVIYSVRLPPLDSRPRLLLRHHQRQPLRLPSVRHQVSKHLLLYHRSSSFRLASGSIHPFTKMSTDLWYVVTLHLCSIWPYHTEFEASYLSQLHFGSEDVFRERNANIRYNAVPYMPLVLRFPIYTAIASLPTRYCGAIYNLYRQPLHISVSANTYRSHSLGQWAARPPSSSPASVPHTEPLSQESAFQLWVF